MKKHLDMQNLLENALIPNTLERKELQKRLKSRTWHIRNDAIEALGAYPSSQNEPYFYQMTFDKNELVQLTAIEMLGMGRSRKSLHRLRTLLSHRSRLVRGYAASSFFDVWVNCFSWNEKSRKAYLRYIEGFEKKETSLWVKANYDRNRYLAGDERGMERLFYILRHAQGKDYHIKSAAVNCLKNICNIQNESAIKQRLEDMMDVFEGCYLKKEVQDYVETPECIHVLLLDEKNTGISQMLECIGNHETEIVFSSAGISPAESIHPQVTRFAKKRYGIDLERYQMPSDVVNVWRYDYIVPLGVSIAEKAYPFQKIIRDHEKAKTFPLQWEACLQMIKEISEKNCQII